MFLSSLSISLHTSGKRGDAVLCTGHGPRSWFNRAWPEPPLLILSRQTGRVHYKEVEAVELWSEGAEERLTVAQCLRGLRGSISALPPSCPHLCSGEEGSLHQASLRPGKSADEKPSLRGAHTELLPPTAPPSPACSLPPGGQDASLTPLTEPTSCQSMRQTLGLSGLSLLWAHWNFFHASFYPHSASSP